MCLVLSPQGCFLSFCLPAVLWAIHLEQEQISVTKQPLQSSSATFTCKVFGGSDSTYIHWYRARAGEAPQRLLYLTLSGSELKREAGFSSEKFLAYPISTLVVNEIAPNDEATYYCAYWDRTVLESHRQPVQKPHS
uniref:Ig-like domain-containing protein n=1 Tax=Terrapene triunguis TaxID=2587831 RepID=A0A674J3V6_9SAUR